MNTLANAEKTTGFIERLNHFFYLLKRTVYYFYSGFQFALHLMGPNASEEDIENRKQTCGVCMFTDMDGDRLFRQDEKGRYFCGKPLFEKKLREPQKDGCGCFLKLKWKKKYTKCPLQQW